MLPLRWKRCGQALGTVPAFVQIWQPSGDPYSTGADVLDRDQSGEALHELRSLDVLLTVAKAGTATIECAAQSCRASPSTAAAGGQPVARYLYSGSGAALAASHRFRQIAIGLAASGPDLFAAPR